MIKVWSSSKCPMCTSVKTYLDARSVEYTNVDVATEDVSELLDRGIASIPVVSCGETFIRGFNVAAIDALLEEVTIR